MIHVDLEKGILKTSGEAEALAKEIALLTMEIAKQVAESKLKDKEKYFFIVEGEDACVYLEDSESLRTFLGKAQSVLESECYPYSKETIQSLNKE